MFDLVKSIFKNPFKIKKILKSLGGIHRILLYFVAEANYCKHYKLYEQINLYIRYYIPKHYASNWYIRKNTIYHNETSSLCLKTIIITVCGTIMIDKNKKI